jgi:predicted PurR-regulated permease PerM
MRNKRSDKRGTIRLRVPLNALAFGVALGGIALPMFMQTPARLVADAQSMMADSGAALTAAVPPNPYNTLAQQLDAKEQALNDREAALSAQDRKNTGLSFNELFGFISFALSIFLFALIGLNFYLDSRQRSKGSAVSSRFSVDLR